MSTADTDTQRELLQAVERRYRKRGYQVLVHPHSRDLPGFLAGFEPDMIAYSADERVVVEVKTGADLHAAPYLAELADAVNSQKGWRFDLAVVKPRRAPGLDGAVSVV